MIFRESHDAPECHLALTGRVCLIVGHIVVITCTIQFVTMHVSIQMQLRADSLAFTLYTE